MVSMRRKSREDRQKDFEKQAAARQAQAAPQGAPGAPGRVPFNPNPLGPQSGVTIRLTQHLPQGDVVVDPAVAQQMAREAAAAQTSGEPSAPAPQLTPEQAAAMAAGAAPQSQPQPVHAVPTQPVQPQQAPAAVPPGFQPHPAAAQVPPPQAAAQPQPQLSPGASAGIYGVPQMPVHHGEVAPTSSMMATPPGATLPSSAFARGMAPSHVQNTPGVYPPSMVVQHQSQAVPAAPVPTGPQQLVVQSVEGGEAAEPLDVTVIFTSWARPQLLRPQFLAIAQQSRPASSMVAWVNAPPAGGPPGVPLVDEEVLAQMLQVRSSINWGPWPRFDFALEAQTEYVVILDDDAVPGDGWLEAAIKTVEEDGVAVAVTGSLFDADGNETLVGPGSNENTLRTVVDAGRQGWVLKREWLQAYRSLVRKGHKHYGWGIHLATALQKLGIDTVVLPYSGDQSLWGTTVPEQPDGLRNISEASEVRATVFKGYREEGWNLLADASAEG